MKNQDDKKTASIIFFRLKKGESSSNLLNSKPLHFLTASDVVIVENMDHVQPHFSLAPTNSNS